MLAVSHSLPDVSSGEALPPSTKKKKSIIFSLFQTRLCESRRFRMSTKKFEPRITRIPSPSAGA